MKKNLSINGLRGLCSLMVFVTHFLGMAYINGMLPSLNTNFNSTLGDIGVHVFFIISGFLILQSLLRYESMLEFLKNRVIRIYPVFLPLLILMFLAGIGINYEWIGDLSASAIPFHLITNLLLLPGMFDLPSAVRNSWSLSYEFAFYIFSCITFFILTKSKFSNSKSAKILLIIFFSTVAILVIAYRPRAIYFVVGTIIFYLLKTNQMPHKLVNGYLTGFVTFSLMFISYMNGYELIAWILSFAFFMTVVHESGLSSRILQSRLFQYYGNISYSLYLIHPFGLFPARLIADELVGTDNNALWFGVFFLISASVSTVASYISYKYLEVKFPKYWKRRKSDKRQLPIEVKLTKQNSL